MERKRRGRGRKREGRKKGKSREEKEREGKGRNEFIHRFGIMKGSKWNLVPAAGTWNLGGLWQELINILSVFCQHQSLLLLSKFVSRKSI